MIEVDLESSLQFLVYPAYWLKEICQLKFLQRSYCPDQRPVYWTNGVTFLEKFEDQQARPTLFDTLKGTYSGLLRVPSNS